MFLNIAHCFLTGKKYELQVYNIVKKCKLNNHFFNLQNETDLGGYDSKNDIECIMNGTTIPIEIKKLRTPDWMQCSLKYNYPCNRWFGSSKNKIPDKSKKIFEEYIYNVSLFNGNIPVFIYKDITYNEWLNIKKNTTDFNDIYMDCSNDTIKKLYSEKGCKYIQISDKGLYHLGDDICEFNVPEFICEQQLRIRTKIHATHNSKGFCKLSVIISCQPKNIIKMPQSKYSLDDISKLPENLKL
jgi:hypothetical protein